MPSATSLGSPRMSFDGRLRLTPSESWRIAGVWIATRLVVLGTVAVVHWNALSAQPTLDQYATHWDYFESLWYADIARTGYVGEGDFRFNTAYFPGLALVMRAGLLIGIQPAVTGLVVSLAAGVFASLAIGLLTKQAGGSSTWGTVAWLVAPTAVFLAAPWSEALFAAFAFWAWVMARRRAWVWAGALAGVAAIVRVNGVFLAVGLVIMWLVTDRREFRRGAALLLPFAVVAAHFAYLHSLTGRWTEWRDVQAEFWGRHTVDPVTALRNSVALIWDFVPGTISTRFIGEIIAVLVLTGMIAVIAWRRWWPEAVYVGLTLLSLATSSFYYSVPRTTVLLFPVWVILGLWLTRHRWLRWAYLALGLPALVLVTVRFSQGQWIS